jgi:predicted RNA-binding Zn ribbon-like protein
MSETRKRIKRLKLVGGALCLDFANTDDLLNDYDDLVTWALRAGAIDESAADRLRHRAEETPDRARKAFDRAIALLAALRRIFAAGASGGSAGERDLALVSSAVGRSAKHLQLRASSNGFGWEWSGAEDQLDWPGWIVARSAVELLTSDQRDRVRECSAPDCNWLFVDTSRNRSRRWCDMAECGNRAKARRNYARKRRVAEE